MADNLNFTANKTYTKHKIKVTTSSVAKDLFNTDNGSENSIADINYIWYFNGDESDEFRF